MFHLFLRGPDKTDNLNCHIQGLGLAYPNINPIYDLLEHVKGLVLQNDTLRIYMYHTDMGVYLRGVLVRVQ